MSSLLKKKAVRGIFFPGGTPRIDWSNPITAGLVGCWVVTGEGGSIPVIRDLVTQTKMFVFGTGQKIVAGPAGLEARDFTNGGWGATLTATQKPTTAFTVLWAGRIISTVSSGTTLFGGLIAPLASPFVTPGILRSTTTSMGLNYNNGTIQQPTFSNVLTSGSSGECGLLVSATLGASHFIYNTGKLAGSGSAPSGTITYGSGAEIGFGCSESGAASPTGTAMLMGALWSRQLTPGESALISADPTSFLIFPEDDLWGISYVKSASSAFSATLADSTATSDSYTETTATTATISETSATSTSYTETTATAASLAETSATSTSYTETTASAATVSETSATSDSYTETAATTASLAETSATSDSYTETAVMTATLAETSATSDSYIGSLAGAFNAAITETATTSDLYSETLAAASTLTDTVATSDLYSETMAATVTLAETLATSDSYIGSVAGAFSASITETTATLDLYAETMAAVRTLAETAATSDLYTLSNGILVVVTLQSQVEWGSSVQHDVMLPFESGTVRLTQGNTLNMPSRIPLRQLP